MEYEINDLSIVFIGEFNPTIIVPFWLAHKKIIQESDAENAKLGISHPEVTSYDLDWANIEIQPQRFQIRTAKESHFEIIKDLSVSIFNVLKDTPLHNLGINHAFHYKVGKKKYTEIGNRLANLNIWQEVLHQPKLLHIGITEDPRNDGLSGSYHIRIYPSNLITPYGICLDINDHFNRSNNSKIIDATEINNILVNKWRDSLNRAKEISNNLWKNLDL